MDIRIRKCVGFSVDWKQKRRKIMAPISVEVLLNFSANKGRKTRKTERESYNTLGDTFSCMYNVLRNGIQYSVGMKIFSDLFLSFFHLCGGGIFCLEGGRNWIRLWSLPQYMYVYQEEAVHLKKYQIALYRHLGVCARVLSLAEAQGLAPCPFHSTVPKVQSTLVKYGSLQFHLSA